MKFLHISDIHFDPINSGRATRDLREKFYNYTKEKQINDRDIVFFTGDFRHARNQAGQNPNIVAKNAVDFLCEIAMCVGVTNKRHIHIVPGNHDLDRETDPKLNEENLDVAYKQYDQYDGRFTGYLNRGSVTTSDYLRSRFGFFEKCVSLLENNVWADFRNGLIHRYQNFDDFSIIYLNTAIACGRDSDRHNLLLGTDDFDRVLRQTSGNPIIILAHNPLSHLAYVEQTTIKNMLKDSNIPVLWFCGDVHETQYDNNYNIACIAAGCMIKQSGTEASFFAGEIGKYSGVIINAHGYSGKHGYWQPKEALTKRVNESIPEALKPPLSGDLPKANNLPERNPYFSGRDDQLDTIAKIFNSKNKVTIKQAVTGLGGVGKTQLAHEFAYRYCGNYKTAIWVINAESSLTVFNDFVEFARKLQLKLSVDYKEDELHDSVKSWMIENKNWLIIFDNLDFESAITPYLPNNNIEGNILITTRNTKIDFGKFIDLAVFEIGEAIEFLDNRLAGCNWVEKDNIAIKTELIERLGRLPLALEQAAAYIKVTRTKYSRYLDILGESGLEAFEFDDTNLNKPKYYEKSITTTWEISFNAIAHEGSKQLFYCCSYMASDKIPINLFAEERKMLPKPICDDLSTIYSTNKIVADLRSYSLISGDSEYINIHRLVQEVVRRKLSTDYNWLLCCLSIMSVKLEYKWGDTVSMGAFSIKTPHALSIIKFSEDLLSSNNEAMKKIATLYHVLAQGNCYMGRFKISLELLQKSLKIRGKILNNNHPDIGYLHNDFGYIYDSLYDYENAVISYKKALSIREVALGKQHLDTGITYGNLGLTYKKMGEHQKALKMYNKYLEIAENKNASVEIANACNKIAGVYLALRELKTALVWYNRSEKQYESYGLEKDHPHYLYIYNNKGHVYMNLEDYSKALSNMNLALDISRNIFGNKNPETATILKNIALVYEKINKKNEAIKYYQEAYAIRKEVFGEDFTQTVVILDKINSLSEMVIT